MMDRDERDVVSRVYRKFCDLDEAIKGWTKIDDAMAMLEFLNDQEVIVEAAICVQRQKLGQPRCRKNHPVSECFVPIVVEGVENIIKLYAESPNLHPKNRFVLCYYLSLSQTGHIIS